VSVRRNGLLGHGVISLVRGRGNGRVRTGSVRHRFGPGSWFPDNANHADLRPRFPGRNPDVIGPTSGRSRPGCVRGRCECLRERLFFGRAPEVCGGDACAGQAYLSPWRSVLRSRVGTPTFRARSPRLQVVPATLGPVPPTNFPVLPTRHVGSLTLRADVPGRWDQLPRPWDRRRVAGTTREVAGPARGTVAGSPLLHAAAHAEVAVRARQNRLELGHELMRFSVPSSSYGLHS